MIAPSSTLRSSSLSRSQSRQRHSLRPHLDVSERWNFLCVAQPTFCEDYDARNSIAVLEPSSLLYEMFPGHHALVVSIYSGQVVVNSGILTLPEKHVVHRLSYQDLLHPVWRYRQRQIHPLHAHQIQQLYPTSQSHLIWIYLLIAWYDVWNLYALAKTSELDEGERGSILENLLALFVDLRMG